MYESTVHLRPTHPLEVSLLHPKSKGVFRLRGRLLSLAALPPIHFGREEGVERTLLRVACQSETFLASPWQGDANIRFLWHIGCQSEFEECFRRMTRISFVIYRHTGFFPVPLTQYYSAFRAELYIRRLRRRLENAHENAHGNAPKFFYL